MKKTQKPNGRPQSPRKLDKENGSHGSAFSKYFSRFSHAAAHATGTPAAFLLAALTILVWAITGPLFHYSDTWQLVINTGTTIVTFLMVFLIQSTQNRDSKAVHLKLDELVRSSQARNVFADLESASDAELESLQREFEELRKKSRSQKTGAPDPSQTGEQT